MSTRRIMKKIVIVLFYLITFMFGVNTIKADNVCTYTYVYSEYTAGGESTSSSAIGATIELTIYSDGTSSGNAKKGNGNIVFGINNGFDFGTNESLLNWTETHCPLYIAAQAPSGTARGFDWYGYDSKPDFSDFKIAGTGIHIFMNDNPSDNSYSCHYDGFSVTFDQNGYAKFATAIGETSAVNTVIYSLDSSLTETSAEEPGICENVFTCVTQSSVSYDVETGLYFTYYKHKVFSDSIALENSGVCQESGFNFAPKDNQSEETSEESGDNPTCRTYTNLRNEFRDSYNLCKENKIFCSQSDVKKEHLSTLCSAIIQYSDYDDSCLIKCLNFKQDILDIEKSADSSKICGFSGRLITFVANIIRWVKYIIPVIVIVLGILDFMKAMGADKEDEMKKAQQRFIRRLIAAALIFLVPIIIEFILNKMGFDANGCGIINL